MKYAHQTPFTHVFNRFEYYVEDFDCALCANFKTCGRSKTCEFQDLKDEAVRHNRIKRPRGWNKWAEE